MKLVPKRGKFRIFAKIRHMKRRDLFLPIAYTVGYMLKVMKNRRPIRRFRREFAAIRHGDYHEFIRLVGGEIPWNLVADNDGIRTIDNVEDVRGQIHFIGMMLSSPSLKQFKRTAKAYFGEMTDIIPDAVFRRLAIFEIAIRMRVTNFNPALNNSDLERVIDELPLIFPELTQEEMDQLHDGRKYLNDIKHNKNKSTLGKFRRAYSILQNHDITVF